MCVTRYIGQRWAPQSWTVHAVFSQANNVLEYSSLPLFSSSEKNNVLECFGLPLLSSRITMQDCSSIIEKLRKRLTGWKSKILSSAGGVELIRSTLSTLHLFWASSFLLLRACLQLLDKHVRNFFRGKFENEKSMKTIAWTNICMPTDLGGVGIKSVVDMADAMILRQVWGIASKRQLLWCSWVCPKYIKEKIFWDPKISAKCSWGWWGILKKCSEVIKSMIHVIGNGKDTSFWLNPWLPEGKLLDRYSQREVLDLGLERSIKVGAFICQNGWVFPMQRPTRSRRCSMKFLRRFSRTVPLRMRF